MINKKKTPSATKIQSAKNKINNDPTILEKISSVSEIDLLSLHCGEFRDRHFSPLTTVWIFLTQILNPDRSCRAAVAHYISTLNKKVCSLATGGYCQARKRLSEDFIKGLVKAQSELLNKQVEEIWLWKKRSVKIVDGTTISMPDSEDNQLHFPATDRRRNPVEFPIARIVAVICKTTGTIVDAAIGTYQGKGSGETSLFKQLYSNFQKGDICVFDRFYSGYFTLAALMGQGTDIVSRKSAVRKITFSKKLGINDYLFSIKRPPKPSNMSDEEYETYEKELHLRFVKVNVSTRGFRTKNIELITSLLDKEHSIKDLAELYRDRWFIETDFRSIKSSMGMDVLRCKSAEMIRKEIWMYFYAYNLVRTIIMDASKVNKKHPREYSFKAALQMLTVFRSDMALASGNSWRKIYFLILEKLKSEKVGNRPDRYEPRLKKRRRNDKYLCEPRQLARQKCLLPKVS